MQSQSIIQVFFLSVQCPSSTASITWFISSDAPSTDSASKPLIPRILGNSKCLCSQHEECNGKCIRNGPVGVEPIFLFMSHGLCCPRWFILYCRNVTVSRIPVYPLITVQCLCSWQCILPCILATTMVFAPNKFSSLCKIFNGVSHNLKRQVKPPLALPTGPWVFQTRRV